MRIGAGEIDITPDFTVELCGFASRKQPCAGVAEPIFARAIFLHKPTEKLLWMTADVLAFDPRFVDEFRDWTGKQFELAPQQVLLSATHTHSAPSTIELTGAGSYSAKYVAMLREKFQALARQVIAGDKRCDVVAARAEHALTIDRRNKPTKHVDSRVTVLGFRDAESDDFIAAVLNYTMHPVTLGHIERCISPDWCGGASTELTSSLPGKPVSLITNGAAGNQNPPMHGASREQVRKWGAEIAQSVVAGLRENKSTRDPQLKVVSTIVTIPMDWKSPEEIERIALEKLAAIDPAWEWRDQFSAAVNAWRDRLVPLVKSGGGKTLDVELQAARIGEAIVLAVNGEMFSRFTDDVRRASGIDELFVVGYSNHGFGYIPTREAYAEGGYETDTAHFFYGSFRPTPGGLELLAAEGAKLVQSL